MSCITSKSSTPYLPWNPENHCTVAHDQLCADKRFFCLSRSRAPVPMSRKSGGMLARNSATARAQRSDPPSHHSWRQVFFLSRPLRQVVATNDNLLVVHLPEDLLTLISGHRRGGRQLHKIELRPPIPLLHSSLLIFPLSLPRSAPLRPATGHSHLFEFFSATTVTSLWRSSLPKLPAN